jgi:hypothetical protein
VERSPGQVRDGLPGCAFGAFPNGWLVPRFRDSLTSPHDYHWMRKGICLKRRKAATHSLTFLMNTSPRLLKPAFVATLFKTESSMSLFSSLKLVTPATLLSGSLY